MGLFQDKMSLKQSANIGQVPYLAPVKQMEMQSSKMKRKPVKENKEAKGSVYGPCFCNLPHSQE